MFAISAQLIMGIIKRRHNMMIPWLLLSAIGFVINSLRFAYKLIFSLTKSVVAVTVLKILVSNLLGLGLSALII
ncbi:hypothetical protein FF38_01603 [Lucilia cuprina]|uniref:DUF7027 domain-containing protein n=1 Tax=Lucilia cuprina TaxID=7375 RepID=A0A0L0CEJ2_LUCCU|nr:hypothetical protein FF38_01603 [Lucilia cuprina]